MVKPKIFIEDWKIVEWIWVDNTEVIIGRCYGHPNIPDGTAIRTSEIVKKDIPNGVIETKNSMYILGRAKGK